MSLCFVLLLGVMLQAASDILCMKESTEKYSEFWENPGEYDVWFLGNSHMYDSIYPMELWDKYGIRSYNLAASLSGIPQTYWTMMCALEYSEPKIIVLDVYKVHQNKKYQGEKKVHLGMDSIPLSVTKIRGICDLFGTQEKRFEYLYNFSIYHNRWEELEEGDFHVQISAAKGARTLNGIKDFSDYRVIGKECKSKRTDTVGFCYLKKIIEECRKRDIKLVLTAIPFRSKKKEQEALNAVTELAREYGVPYLNMAYDDLLDYGVDFANKGHVNMFGAKKMTHYIGDYLTEHYDLTDYRDYGEVSEKWAEDYARYQNQKLESISQTDELGRYVQWLSDERYTCYLYREKKPEGLLAKEFAQLNNITLISKEEAEGRLGGEIKGDYAFFVENEKGEVVDAPVFRKGKRQ